MPEYLSPGVYVEEVDTGAKPIEGISTSTAGMVGCTERGPESVPELITSFGEFRRIYGELLPAADFTDLNGGLHSHLPHAVQGFFTNDGRRVYIVRALPPEAAHAELDLFDRGDANAADTRLLRAAPQDSGTQVNGPLLYALDLTDIGVNDWVRVGQGSRSEYRQVVARNAAAAHLALSAGLGLSYPVAGTTLFSLPDAYGGFDLAADAAAGDIQITLVEIVGGEAANLVGEADPVFLEVQDAEGNRHYLAVSAVVAGGAANEADITLAEPLALDLAAATTAVDAVAVPAAPLLTTTLELAATAGDLLLYPLDPVQFAAGDWAVIRTGVGDEVRRVGTFGLVSLDLGSYQVYPAFSRVQLALLQDLAQPVQDPPPPAVLPATTNTQFVLAAVGPLEAGMQVEMQGVERLVIALDQTTGLVTLDSALPGVPANNDPVTPFSELSADLPAGTRVLSLTSRLGLEAGDRIRVGAGAQEEFATIVRVNGERAVAPDAGSLVLSAPVVRDHAAGARVHHQDDQGVEPARQAAITLVASGEGDRALFLNDETGYGAGDIVLVTTPGGAEFHHRLVADAMVVNPGTLELDVPLAFSHESGATVAERQRLLSVRALDRGAAGNRLQVAVEDAPTPLVQARLTDITPPRVIELDNFTGVESGSLLELTDPDTGAAILPHLKVRSVDRAAGEVELDPPGLDPAHIAAHNAAAGLAQTLGVRSREFLLRVFLLQRPDPAIPSRNGTVIDSEQFLCVMDARHSAYLHRVIGTTWAAGADQDLDGNPLRLWDQRSAGQSGYIRVRDLAAGNAAITESIRLGPEDLVDVLDNAQQRPARLSLSGGDDAADAMGDAMYLGQDSDEPRLRSGIHALRNIDAISIVAVPGQTGVTVQQALINHCEADRYRFAVLDAQGPDQDSLADVQAQRQRYDSRYAALYHPWLMVPEPHPANVADIRQIAIPPSGHVIGVYARTDNTRGVHKAPANELLRGITGVARKLNRREQDILNPSPMNVNVIRDFQADGRGLRIWGARCITSDTEHKYVNVRRLLIFLEESIDEGVQWVVFEPNEEVTWARVRRAISNFLTVVWRNGALEGASPEQAFFVRCDRTTMTQTDIDSGRLIAVIGVAPVRPAEFVIVRIGLWTNQASQ